MKLKQTKWIIGLTFIAIGILIVTVSTLPKSTQYYVTVDELLSDKAKYAQTELKVAGKVQPGSIKKSEKDMTWEFNVENKSHVIQVMFSGAMPDTFKETADVVVTGKYDGQNFVQATEVLAKCASRYEEKLSPTYQSKPRT